MWPGLNGRGPNDEAGGLALSPVDDGTVLRGKGWEMRAGLTPWPDEVVRHYVEAGFWRHTALGAWAWTWAERYAERTALVEGDNQITYRELAERSDALALRLLSLGLEPGDNIVVQLPNCWEFVVLFLACQRIGVAPALALAAHRERELSQIATKIQAKAIAVPDRWRDFDHQELAALVAGKLAHPVRVLVAGASVRPEYTDLRALIGPGASPAVDRHRLDQLSPDPLDAAFFLLSGGTTGIPKLIARTHNDYEYAVRQSTRTCGWGLDTVYLAALPIAHAFALGAPGVFGTLSAGGKVVMASSPSPDTAFALIASERVTNTAVTPAVAHRWLEAAVDRAHSLASLETLQIGGSPLAVEVASRIEPELGCRLQQVFGMAEGLICYTRPEDTAEVALATQGRPMSPGDEVRLVDDEDRPVPVGQVGELLSRGPYTIRGYFAESSVNMRAFTGDGWYRSGDLVQQDALGNLIVRGRIKDIINRGGEKVSAEEIETVLGSLPQVKQVSIVPVPDPDLGERACACVVLLPGGSLDLAEVRAACDRMGLAHFKAPEQIEFFEDLPLTPVGKVDKKALRNQATQPRATGSAGGGQTSPGLE